MTNEYYYQQFSSKWVLTCALLSTLIRQKFWINSVHFVDDGKPWLDFQKTEKKKNCTNWKIYDWIVCSVLWSQTLPLIIVQNNYKKKVIKISIWILIWSQNSNCCWIAQLQIIKNMLNFLTHLTGFRSFQVYFVTLGLKAQYSGRILPQ